jgi:hypothetical protein
MARGWESKNVEAQQEERAKKKPSGRLPTPEELGRADHRRSLDLTRARMVDELRRATAPPHRTMLEQAIAVVEEQIASLK